MNHAPNPLHNQTDASSHNEEAALRQAQQRIAALEAELAETKYQLYQVIEHTPMAVATVDTDMRYLHANARWLSDYRVEKRELTGVSHYEVFPEIGDEWRQFHQEALTGESFRNPKDPFPRADGTLDWVRWELRPWYKTDHTIGGLMLFSEVITEQVVTQDRLTEQQQLLRDVLDTIPVRVFWKDRNSVFLGCNRLFAADAGAASPDEMIGKTDYDYYSREAAMFQADDRVVMESGNARMHFEESQITPDSKQMWLRTNKIPLRNADGEVIGVLGTFEDITVQKLAQEALKQSEQLLRDVLNTIPVRVFWKDRQSRYMGANDLTVQDLGLKTVDELMGTTDADYFIPEVAAHFQELDRKVLETGENLLNVEEPTLTVNGQTLWYSTSKTPLRNADGEIIGVLGIYTDITARKEAEEALRISQERFNLAIEGSHAGLWDLDVIHNQLFVSPRWKEMLGYAPDDLLASSVEKWRDLVHPNDLEHIEQQVNDHLQGKVPIYQAEYRMRRKDGTWCWVMSHGKALFDSVTRGVYRMSGSNIDITALKQAEEAHRRSEQNYRTLVDHLPNMVVNLRDRNHRFILAGGPDMARLGLTRESFEGHTASDVFTPDKAALGDAYVDRALNGEMVIVENEVMGQIYLSHYVPIYDPDNPTQVRHVLTLAQNITERKQAEEALRISQERFNLAMEGSGAGLWDWDIVRNVMYFSPRYKEMLGYNEETFPLSSNAWDVLVHPDDYDTTWVLVNDHLDGKTPHYTAEYRMQHSDGRWRWILAHGKALQDANGKAYRMSGSHIDITDRKNSELMLQIKSAEEQIFQRYLKSLHEISIELTMIDNLDEFYRQTIQLALDHFDLDRMGLWLYDSERNIATGTYGTDIQGQLQSEFHLEYVPRYKGGMWETMQSPERFFYEEPADLFHHLNVVGIGWRITIALRFGNRNLGWLSVDNLIHGLPVSQAQLDVLAQYGMFIASSLARKQVEVALRASEARYRMLASNLPDMTAALYDHDLRFLLVDGLDIGASGLLKEHEGYTLYQVSPPEVIAFFEPLMRAALHGEKQAVEALSPNSERTFMLMFVPVKNEKGEVVSALALAQNITARRKAEAQREALLHQTEQLYRFSRAMQTMEKPDDVLVAVENAMSEYQQQPNMLTLFYCDPYEGDQPEWLRIAASRGGANVMPTGESTEELRIPVNQYSISQLWLQAIDQPSILEDVAADSRVDVQLQVVLETMGIRSVVYIPLKQGGRWSGVLSLSYDQPCKFSESMLALFRAMPSLISPVISNLRLLDNLEHTIQDLQVAKRAAEESSRLKSEFLSTMSHELRTPLNAIEGFTSIMLSNMGVELEPRARGMVERVGANSKRLLHLINDILDLSRIEAGRTEIMLVKLSPRKLAKKWHGDVSVLAEKKGLRFSVEMDASVPEVLYGDEDALTKIVSNLLSNAIKFTTEGSVTLSMRVEDKFWRIEVADTGIGIPPHAHSYIFDEFRQVDGSSKRLYGGTGLGLAIVQKLARLLGGTISLQSEVGQGSTFTLMLPLIAEMR